MKENFTYDQPTRPTATALVGLSHRGSRVETHVAAAMRHPYSGPLGVFAVVEKENGAENLHYVLKDHLGSWTTLTDDQGTVLQELSFDAWGNLRASASWSGQYNGVLLYDRGFTGHEHLFSFGLINMNGRMYDPVMSSFLSVDNYVQAPDFSQSFNRYAYCLNNPLRYVDPSGELFWVIPNIGYSKEGGLSLGLTFAVGLPGLWSAQASLGYSVGSQSVYASAGVTFAGVTGYISGGYSFSNEQAFSSIGITAGLSPYSGVPFSTNIITVGASCDLTYSKAAGYDISFTGNLSAWSYNTTAKAWNFNPSVSVMVYPEHTTNLVRGQGFRSNDAVLRRFVAANNHQGALDYFGFEGKYDNSITDPGQTNPNTGDISYNEQAFKSFDYLKLCVDHETTHQKHILSGMYEGVEMTQEMFGLEEMNTYLHNYRNQGLYLDHGVDIMERIHYYGWKAMVERDFAPQWWHFIYKIPRLY